MYVEYFVEYTERKKRGRPRKRQNTNDSDGYATPTSSTTTSLSNHPQKTPRYMDKSMKNRYNDPHIGHTSNFENNIDTSNQGNSIVCYSHVLRLTSVNCIFFELSESPFFSQLSRHHLFESLFSSLRQSMLIINTHNQQYEAVYRCDMIDMIQLSMTESRRILMQTTPLLLNMYIATLEDVTNVPNRT